MSRFRIYHCHRWCAFAFGCVCVHASASVKNPCECDHQNPKPQNRRSENPKQQQIPIRPTSQQNSKKKKHGAREIYGTVLRSVLFNVCLTNGQNLQANYLTGVVYFFEFQHLK